MKSNPKRTKSEATNMYTFIFNNEFTVPNMYATIDRDQCTTIAFDKGLVLVQSLTTM